jgi:hypothetical protein
MSHADFRLVYLAISPRGFEALVGSFDTSNSVVRIEISTVGRSFWQSQLGLSQSVKSDGIAKDEKSFKQQITELL